MKISKRTTFPMTNLHFLPRTSKPCVWQSTVSMGGVPEPQSFSAVSDLVFPINRTIISHLHCQISLPDMRQQTNLQTLKRKLKAVKEENSTPQVGIGANRNSGILPEVEDHRIREIRLQDCFLQKPIKAERVLTQSEQNFMRFTDH